MRLSKISLLITILGLLLFESSAFAADYVSLLEMEDIFERTEATEAISDSDISEGGFFGVCASGNFEDSFKENIEVIEKQPDLYKDDGFGIFGLSYGRNDLKKMYNYRSTHLSENREHFPQVYTLFYARTDTRRGYSDKVDIYPIEDEREYGIGFHEYVASVLNGDMDLARTVLYGVHNSELNWFEGKLEGAKAFIGRLIDDKLSEEERKVFSAIKSDFNKASTREQYDKFFMWEEVSKSAWSLDKKIYVTWNTEQKKHIWLGTQIGYTNTIKKIDGVLWSRFSYFIGNRTRYTHYCRLHRI